MYLKIFSHSCSTVTQAELEHSSVRVQPELSCINLVKESKICQRIFNTFENYRKWIHSDSMTNASLVFSDKREEYREVLIIQKWHKCSYLWLPPHNILSPFHQEHDQELTGVNGSDPTQWSEFWSQHQRRWTEVWFWKPWASLVKLKVLVMEVFWWQGRVSPLFSSTTFSKSRSCW